MIGCRWVYSLRLGIPSLEQCGTLSYHPRLRRRATHCRSVESYGCKFQTVSAGILSVGIYRRRLLTAPSTDAWAVSRCGFSLAWFPAVISVSPSIASLSSGAKPTSTDTNSGGKVGVERDSTGAKADSPILRTSDVAAGWRHDFGSARARSSQPGR